MPAIFTHYIGPTNFKPSRVKAVTASKMHSVTLCWDHDLNMEGNHRAAAITLIEKMEALSEGGWKGEWLQADAGSDGSYVFVKNLRMAAFWPGMPFSVGDKVRSTKQIAEGFIYEVVAMHTDSMDVRCIATPDNRFTEHVYERQALSLFVRA